ncbi:pancreatic triacylglycerol lipase-like [Arctopsyche grandis]|uniref:pancreatic triacylglycerol lipase-like n=1 Tax=Arctopsyche grandis TaxID=121162 RepID=UPI00406D7942
MIGIARLGIIGAIVAWTALVGPSSAGILDQFSWARADRIEVNLPWLPFENESRCYDELGCLNITRSWYHLIHRPINIFPLPRSVINTRFILYTKKNPSEGQILNPNVNKTIVKSNFFAERPTKIIIHGFIDTPFSNWVSEMKDELVKHGDYNVVVVDWAGGSLPLYTQATANTRLVGLEVAHFLLQLQKYHGLNPGDIHIIGHSLGAHTAGYAAEKVEGVGRITGLDPAEPYFQGMGNHVRLDPSDANFVDIIHTDGKSILLLGYGMSQPVGHLDFYPNDGKEQPGCELAAGPLIPLTLVRQGLEEASRVLVACNHVRAIKLFVDSINGKCPYIGHQCPSYQHFLDGKCFNCAHGCAIMGFHADSSPGLITHKSNQSENEVTPSNTKENLGAKYFMTTGKDYPYCQRHYRIVINLAHPKGAESWVQGFLKASLHSDRGVIRGLDLTPNNYVRLEHGTTHTTVVTHPVDLGGKIRKVELSWEYDMNVLEPRSLCLFWCNDHLYVKSITVDEMELPTRGKRNIDFKNKLCTPKRDFAEIPNRGSANFYDRCAL